MAPLLLWVTIAAAATIVLLAYFSHQIIVFTAIYLPYSIVGLGARLVARRQIARVRQLVDGDDKIPAAYTAAVTQFYVERPHGLIGTLSIALATAALLAALGQRSVAQHGVAVAIPHILVIASILLTEVFVWSWRARLYLAVDNIDTEQRSRRRLTSHAPGGAQGTGKRRG
jgi:hypothetical protein